MEAQGFPCGSAGKESACKKESACNVGRPGFDPWVGKIPWRREQLLTPILWPGEFHGLYSPWGRKELDTTEQLTLHTHTIIYIYIHTPFYTILYIFVYHLEKGMAAHLSILVRRIPWTEKPGRLQPMGHIESDMTE